MTIEPLTPERRRRQTRDHLLQAAAIVFAERGFHGASLDEVAAVAGFTKGAVYSNFKNKEGLFLALLESRYQRELDALHAALSASEVPPEARLSDFVALIREQAPVADDNWTTLYLEFWLYALRNPQAREKLARFDDLDVASVAEILVAERKRSGIEASEAPQHVARMIVALFRGVGMMRALHPATVDDAFLETVMGLVARALTPPTEH